MKGELFNPDVFEVQNPGGLVDYLSDLSHPEHQVHIRRLRAGNPAATLFTFASLHALIRKYGLNTPLREALHREAGAVPVTNPPAGLSRGTLGGKA